MKRRDVFTAAVMGAATMAATAQAQSNPGKAKTYVLVHGAWHGGWCWRDVVTGLRAQGHTVFAPTLTGLGERVHLMSKSVNLSTHVTDVVNVFEFEELSDVILVGHSYAGHVIPLVADRIKARIRHLVFLDAVVAQDGKAFLPPGVGEERAKTARDGYLQDPPEVPWFGVPADHPNAAWVRRRLTPHPLPTLMEPVRFQNDGHAGLPKTYIRCLKRREMTEPDPMAVAYANNPDWTWLTLDTGHDAMVTMPKELTDMLGRIG
ncbi:MAG: alpha/beta hydrolase [Rhodospirillaceae bacterium]|nr:alpha/beta hydrolase [Rhodospirillaceae bacterium]